MGNICGSCCGEEKKDDNNRNSLKAYNLNDKQNNSQSLNQNISNNSDKTQEQLNTSDANTPLAGASNPTDYRAASREEVAAAAERRAAEQKAKNEVKTLKHTSAELPSNPNQGLRWQVG